MQCIVSKHFYTFYYLYSIWFIYYLMTIEMYFLLCLRLLPQMINFLQFLIGKCTIYFLKTTINNASAYFGWVMNSDVSFLELIGRKVFSLSCITKVLKQYFYFRVICWNLTIFSFFIFLCHILYIVQKYSHVNFVRFCGI